MDIKKISRGSSYSRYLISGTPANIVYGIGKIQKIQKIVGKVGLLALQIQRRDNCRDADVTKRWCPPPSFARCLQAAHVLVELIFDALVARSLVVERAA